MKTITATLSILFALSLTACGEGLPEWTDESAENGSAIVNGQVDHGHPSVGKLRESGQDVCTATLVGKRTVLTAAHCIRKPASKYAFVLGQKSYPADSIKVHPEWNGSMHGGEGINDLAVVILQGTPTVVPSPIATRAPRPGDKITLVGFGVTGQRRNDFGTKRVTTNVIFGVAPLKFYWLPEDGVGTTCYGDSGGPAFAKVDGEEVQIGVTSGGHSPCESGMAWDTRLDAFASWIRQVAKGDVVLQGASSKAAADTEKPRVHISSPASNATVAANAWITVKAKITDDVGVVRGELWIDGLKVRTLLKAPFDFPTQLAKGQHQVRVYGFDAAGNAGRYTVTVTAK